ncbi:VOC family protein [Roseovarius aestuarii]
MGTDKTSQAVWHDLFTTDRERAMSFYQSLAAWEYVTEHATDFAWGGGTQDYVLALKEGEAGAGIVTPPPDMSTGWVAYVEVDDVDATAALAETLAGQVLRPPFDVPGVGRNALLRDPNGATIGVAMSRHNFPVTRRQFGNEVYLSADRSFPRDFYARLFDWEFSKPQVDENHSRNKIAVQGQIVAATWDDSPLDNLASRWLPTIKVIDPLGSLRSVPDLGGVKLGQMSDAHVPQDLLFLEDADGELVCLTGA